MCEEGQREEECDFFNIPTFHIQVVHEPKLSLPPTPSSCYWLRLPAGTSVIPNKAQVSGEGPWPGC